MYERILIAVDLNDPSSWRKVFPTAAALCDAFGAKLSVLTVVPDFGLPSVAQFFPDDFADRALARAESELDHLIAEHLPSVSSVQRLVAYGTPYTEILRVAREIETDLIVMASHRPELKDYLLGPNAARVVRHARCSVMVVRE